jgi:hypothetical protein
MQEHTRRAYQAADLSYLCRQAIPRYISDVCIPKDLVGSFLDTRLCFFYRTNDLLSGYPYPLYFRKTDYDR